MGGATREVELDRVTRRRGPAKLLARLNEHRRGKERDEGSMQRSRTREGRGDTGRKKTEEGNDGRLQHVRGCMATSAGKEASGGEDSSTRTATTRGTF